VCGRYRLAWRKQIVEEYFDTASGEEDWSPRYNIAPTQPVAVIRQNPKENSTIRSAVNSTTVSAMIRYVGILLRNVARNNSRWHLQNQIPAHKRKDFISQFLEPLHERGFFAGAVSDSDTSCFRAGYIRLGLIRKY